MNGSRRLVAIVVAVIGLAAAGCSTPEPTASNVVPPPESSVAPLVFLALGGDEAVAPEPPLPTGDPGTTTTTSAAEELTASWVHRAFRSLPLQASNVDLSLTGATAVETVDRQLPRAAGVEPDVASVWLGPGDEREGTRPDEFRRQLAAVIGTLEFAGVDRILLLTRPEGTPDGRFAPEIRAAAEGHASVRVVVLPRKPPPAEAATTSTSSGSGTGSVGTATTRTVAPPADDRDAVARAVVDALA